MPRIGCRHVARGRNGDVARVRVSESWLSVWLFLEWLFGETQLSRRFADILPVWTNPCLRGRHFAPLAVARDHCTRGSPTPTHRHGSSSSRTAARRPRGCLLAGHPRLRRRRIAANDGHRERQGIREGVPRQVQGERAVDDGPAERALRLPQAGEGGSRDAAREAHAELLHAARDRDGRRRGRQRPDSRGDWRHGRAPRARAHRRAAQAGRRRRQHGR